jgi:uncharacterized RDD family membrane protein YckC
MFCSQCGASIEADAKFCARCGTVVAVAGSAATPLIVTAPTVRPVEYAGFWRRFVAYIIDRIIIGIPASILVMAMVVPSIVAMCNRNWDVEDIPVAIVTFIICWIWLAMVIVIAHVLYFTWFESSRFQATPGKMVLGIIVTDIQGQRISFLRALGRNAGKILSHVIFSIGFILAGVTAKKQALHDMLADCLVVMK